MSSIIRKIASISFVSSFLFSAHLGFSQEWIELTPDVGIAPSPRRNAGAIYDPEAHRLVIFGGKSATGNENDIWAFDLNSEEWFNITPNQPDVPAPRWTPNCVYDADNHQMLMWSGQGSMLFNDVWAFDLTTESWTELAPPDPKPNIRYGAAAIFDPAEKTLVTFAGFTDSGRFNDTWRFGGENGVWADVSPSGNRPEKRCLHSASYDSLNNRMIIYGGQSSGALSDIWAFDLAQNEWTNLTPIDRPAGRYFNANVYDAGNHDVIIFGGNLGATKTNEIWRFDLSSNTWQELTPSGDAPVARDGVTGVYISSEERMVVFGGRDANDELLNEVWSLNLSQPTSIEIPDEPVGDFRLLGNYPNPFNPSTVIVYEILEQAKVLLKIYNVRGQLVKTLTSRTLDTGRHQSVWDGSNDFGVKVDSGVYFYSLHAGRHKATGKMLLLQ